MDNGVTPRERQVEDELELPVERPAERPVERRKPAPRPRKPASARISSTVDSDVAVADRIDPLLAASSAALEEAELAAAKPVRRRPPARKPARPAQPKVVEVADDPLTTELPIVDDFFAEPTVAERRVVERPVAEPVVVEPPVVDLPEVEQTEALVPYVLPKIIPGEPEVAPDPESGPEPKTLTARVSAAFASRPQFLRPQFQGATKRLKRSLQPVVLPRHRPRVRRVTRVVRHIDTWSVFKIAVLFNIFLYAVCLTAGAMLWRVALNTGTIENIERFFESFGWQTFQLKGGEIYHNAWIIGLFGVVGFTGLAVLAATMFNLITDLVGGVRITVLEEEVVARELRVVTWPRLIRPATPPGGKPPTEPSID